jgi:Beta-propeller repeat
MIRRVIFRPIACLMLVITAVPGAGYTSAQAQGQTPHLVFSTYLGGSNPCFPGGSALTFAQNAACDTQGNTYVTGGTQVSDLPVLNAYQPGPAPVSTMSAFVAKYNPAGQPLWCTYLGGNNQSMGIGVAAMPDGGVVVVGLTTSAAPVPFPTTMNAFQGQNNGNSDYFVTVYDANGNITYSTYLGGSGVEGQLPPYADDQNSGNCVAVDAAGLVYVAGMTTSGGGSGATKFPVTANALQPELAGSLDACLCIIDPAQNGAASLVYGSFLGGDKDDQGHSVAVDPFGGYITVAGFTTSSNFPTTANAYRSSAPPGGFSSGCSNGFVTQIQSSQPGSQSSQYTLRYSTYLGANSSTARDDVYGMVMDPTGLIVATGRTQSAGFPMTTGGPSIFNSAPYLESGPNGSGDEPYLVKINPALDGLASLVYATFLGGGEQAGSQNEWGSFCTSVGVDARGTVSVGGESNALGQVYVPSGSPVEAPQKFPYTQNALITSLQGDRDAIFMQIDPGGATLDYSTYLGGNKSSRTYGLAVDPAGNVVLAGLTFSDNFPLKNPAQIWPGNAGAQNAFVTKFSFRGAPIGALLLLLDD